MDTSHSSAGHGVYTPRVLAIYDAWVLGISNRWIWKCPTSRLLAHYNQHVSANHLDVGVGTGYYLDRCRFPAPQPSITLLDINPHALQATARRIARYRPAIYQGDIRAPLDFGGAKFDSIGLNFVLHCLPGDMASKTSVLKNLAQHLAPGGVLFGSTLLGDSASTKGSARWLMHRYQKRGIFNNADDDLASFEAALGTSLTETATSLVGCAALFAGRKPP